MTMPTISKTSFLQYLQCQKLFWTATNDPTKIPWLPRQLDKLRQQEGRQVESLAHGLYQDATQIIRNIPLIEIIAQSNDALLRPIIGKAIFNPIIQTQDLIAELDILLPLEDGSFDLFEVKSSTEIKDHFLPDIAFQCHVLTSAGLKMHCCYLLTLNNKYVRHGDIEPQKLFTYHDVTEGVENISQEIGHQISLAKEILGSKECPDISIGAHCDNPYECPMKEVCWKKVNDCPNNIFTLNRLTGTKKWALYNQGIIESKDIPVDYKLMPRQRIQIECEKTGQTHVNKKEAKEFLDGLVYPLCFLDFETVAPCVPWLDGMKPYQQIPFQFSLHKLDAPDENPYDFGWIWGGNDEVWQSMLFQLKQFLGKTGSIIAYNAAFEKNVLKMAVKMKPEYGDWLDGILERFVDLLVPFRNFVVYHPGQHGSASLKAVLPSWTGESYGNLKIQDGEMAGWAFRRLRESKDEAEIEGIQGELEKYCGLDTRGMVLVVRGLRGLK